ncbi:GNAT family N-acetyltransferase [Paenibacillus sp. GYB006]|uniref:GNAT family N-acetyltransferase n=1 Tax=Paenibacillus sp. GYB006 TaxID=2994394 RepID=UPI002F96B8FC
MEFLYIEKAPFAEDFIKLVESTGWQGIVSKELSKLRESLINSWYLISVYDGKDLIGSGRIISDGILHALICDLIVLPEYHGRGVGTEILKRLLNKCKAHDIVMVQLFAAKDKFNYYKKFGFEERPFDAPGMRWIHKDMI